MFSNGVYRPKNFLKAVLQKGSIGGKAFCLYFAHYLMIPFSKLSILWSSAIWYPEKSYNQFESAFKYCISCKAIGGTKLTSKTNKIIFLLIALTRNHEERLNRWKNRWRGIHARLGIFQINNRCYFLTGEMRLYLYNPIPVYNFILGSKRVE